MMGPVQMVALPRRSSHASFAAAAADTTSHPVGQVSGSAVGSLRSTS